MNPITHLLTSWTIANLPRLESRDRAIVTIAGISPDIDAAGIIVELATKHTDNPLYWWSEYHHVLGHNLTFGLTVFLVAAGVAKRRLLTASLAFLPSNFIYSAISLVPEAPRVTSGRFRTYFHISRTWNLSGRASGL